MRAVLQADFYRKVHTDLVQSSVIGGVLTVVAVAVMAMMFLVETHCYLFAEPTRQMTVEGHLDDTRMRIDLNISLFTVPCELAHVDYSDESGTHMSAFSINKLPLDVSGVLVRGHHVDHVRYHERVREKSQDCGSCYGAEMFEGQCCNTCEQVIEAYSKRGWQMPSKRSISQCTRRLEQTEEKVESPGCQVYGHIVVKRIPGNFHISLNSIGQMLATTGQMEFDASHTVHWLRFTDPEHDHGLSRTGLASTYNEGRILYQYFLKVSPAVSTNGIRFYEASAHFHSPPASSIPTIVFQYDIEPITTVYKHSTSFLQYLVSLCAIIGGWFAITNLVAVAVSKLSS
mmetsp:Transcript_32873/g.57417  ORF Transcript_32873/g.57417 Transcript_32873/m.57417 type:complete len:343 (+) Transcript_32873:6776-7804(+)